MLNYTSFTNALANRFNLFNSVFTLPIITTKDAKRYDVHTSDRNEISHNATFLYYCQNYYLEGNWRGVVLGASKFHKQKLIDFIIEFHNGSLPSAALDEIQSVIDGKTKQFSISENAFSYVVFSEKDNSVELHLSVSGGFLC